MLATDVMAAIVGELRGGRAARTLPSPLVDRSARLVLVDAAGEPLGALPPVPVAMPCWQEASDVVAAAREAYGIDVTVLRLLGPTARRRTAARSPTSPSSTVRRRPACGRSPSTCDRTRSGRRTPSRAAPPAACGWAGGARWAGRRVTATQQRTWNLSAIWRLDGPDGRRAWLKQVPPFFGHEGAVLGWLDRHRCRGWPRT